mmetsp:Transcript_68177/g.200193  ORF Transcript_68177/g.200193 Transcript_68177/m.200193 type:complete len:407 (+) Transcript_68177:508-1728(+)
MRAAGHQGGLRGEPGAGRAAADAPGDERRPAPAARPDARPAAAGVLLLGAERPNEQGPEEPGRREPGPVPGGLPGDRHAQGLGEAGGGAAEVAAPDAAARAGLQEPLPGARRGGGHGGRAAAGLPPGVPGDQRQERRRPLRDGRDEDGLVQAVAEAGGEELQAQCQELLHPLDARHAPGEQPPGVHEAGGHDAPAARQRHGRHGLGERRGRPGLESLGVAVLLALPAVPEPQGASEGLVRGGDGARPAAGRAGRRGEDLLLAGGPTRRGPHCGPGADEAPEGSAGPQPPPPAILLDGGAVQAAPPRDADLRPRPLAPHSEARAGEVAVGLPAAHARHRQPGPKAALQEGLEGEKEAPVLRAVGARGGRQAHAGHQEVRRGQLVPHQARRARPDDRRVLPALPGPEP